MHHDTLHEECGVVAVSGQDDAAALTALSLHALQHRGQEAAGIVTCHDGTFYSHRARGQVGDNFNTEDTIQRLHGRSAIGHVRYSTTGGNALRNIQPLFGEFSFGGPAVAHNGNLTNTQQLRRDLVRDGCLFQTTMDTEVIIHLIARSRRPSVVERLIDALQDVQGAYSLVAMAQDCIIGVRDPWGVRPLALGRLASGSHVLASESCAFDIIGAEFVRDVAPGEMLILRGHTVESRSPFPSVPSRFCIFEYVYFSRPDSLVEDRNVYDIRKRIGAELVQEAPVKAADMVVPVPDSGVPAALGFAEASGIPFELGIIRNHYVGRTFIEPTDEVRHLGVKLKHNANLASLRGKRVVLVDDSIVRGTTSKKIVAMVRESGAKEVHMRIASPPTVHSCFYGVDTPERDKLMAANCSVEEMREIIDADSLAFISTDGLYRAVGEAGRNTDAPQFCDACFTGDYPIPLVDMEDGTYSPAQPSLLLEPDMGR